VVSDLCLVPCKKDAVRMRYRNLKILLSTKHKAQGVSFGFSLLEMSIVLAIIALIVGSGIAVFMVSLQNRQSSETQNKMRVLQQAIYNYRVAYGRLPCPADATQTTDATANNYFGLEAGTLSGGVWTPDAGNCSNAGDSAKANFSNGNNVEGMVPTKTLNLADDYAIDAWGGRIMYAVDKNFTATGALVVNPTIAVLTANTNGMTANGFTSLNALGSYPGTAVTVVGNGIPPNTTITSINYSTLAIGLSNGAPLLTGVTLSFYSGLPATAIPPGDQNTRMSICDASGTTGGACNNAKTTFAAYVLISSGPNNHGAYPRNGGVTRMSSGSNNADELVNCNCTNAGVASGTPFPGVFVQKDAVYDYSHPDHTDDFDDIVLYATRSDLRAPNE